MKFFIYIYIEIWKRAPIDRLPLKQKKREAINIITSVENCTLTVYPYWFCMHFEVTLIWKPTSYFKQNSLNLSPEKSVYGDLPQVELIVATVYVYTTRHVTDELCWYQAEY